MKKRILSAAVSLSITALSIVPYFVYASDEPYADKFTDCVKIESKEWLNNHNEKYEAVYMKTNGEQGAIVYFIESYPDTITFSVPKETDEKTLEQCIKVVDNGLVLQYWKNTPTDKYDCTITLKNDKEEYEKIDSKTAKALYEVLKDHALTIEYSYDQYIYNYCVYEYLTGYEEMQYSFPIEEKLNEYLENNKINAKLIKYSDKELNFLGKESVGETFFIVPDEKISITEHYELSKKIAEETGLRPTGISPTESGVRVESNTLDISEYVSGDTNCDGELNMADAVLIMQSIANPSKYKVTAKGSFNADMDGDGITNLDALAIQKKLLKLE